MADIKNIDVFQTVTSVSFEVEPNTNIININKVTTSGYSGIPNLQDVTDEGATTTNGITITVGDGDGNGIYSTSSQGYGVYGSSSESNGVYGISTSVAGVYGTSDSGYGVEGYSEAGIAIYGASQDNIGVQGNSSDGTAISAYSEYGTGLYAASESGVGVSAQSNSIGLEVNGNGTIAIEANLGNSNKGLVINSGTSSTGNFIELDKNGVDKLVVNQQGELTATKLIKQGGTGLNALLDNGSTVALSAIGGATNLSPSQTATNFTINSDTGTDATIPLGNGTLAGATLNDYTTAEKNKLAAITGTNTGDNAVNSLYSGLAASKQDNITLTTTGSSGAATLVGSTLNIPQYTGGSGSGISNATAAGTDTYTATISGVASYVDGAAFLVRFTNGNTTNATLNINGLGAIALYRNNDGALIGGDIQNGGEMLCVYNSTITAFQCIGTSPNDIVSYVTNADSVTITKGMPVYAFGGTGDRMTVKRAYNTLDATSAQTIGLVMSASIAAGQKGLIITQGLLYGLSTLPTSTFADGDTIYLGATAGTITNVKPYAPNHLVYLGVVTTASAGAAGRMYVKPQNGYELDELHNVQAQSPTLKDTLWYDNTVSPAQWKTASISTILGYTPQDTLQSTVNIKSINGNSILGSGDLTISGTGISSLNGLTGATQTFSATTNTGTGIPAWTSSGTNHQLNIPIAGGATTTGLITGTSQFIAGSKTFTSNPEIPVPAGNSGPCIVLGSTGGGGATGTLSIGSTTTYPNGQEMQYVKGITSSVQTQLDGKQPTLTAGNGINITTNTISTVDTSRAAYTMLANNTNASAIPTTQVFKDVGEQSYAGATPTWTGTTAPSGTTNHSYQWSQIGRVVNLRVNLDYATAGTSLTAVTFDLPSDCPIPKLPLGVSANGDVIAYGNGMLVGLRTTPATPTTVTCALRIKGTGTYEINILRLTASGHKYAYATIQYFAQ